MIVEYGQKKEITLRREYFRSPGFGNDPDGPDEWDELLTQLHVPVERKRRDEITGVTHLIDSAEFD